jgi:predicted ester cyclase
MISEAPARIDGPQDGAHGGAPAPADDHKAVVRRWIDAYNDRDDETEAAVRASGYTAHVGGEPEPLDSTAWTQFIGGFSAAFPDLRLTVEDIVSEGDRVAARVAFRGTHTREFLGIPPTNAEVAFWGMEFNRMVGGKVEEHWVVLDQLSLLRQLGMSVIPGPRLVVPLLVQLAAKLRAKLAVRR